MKMKHWLRLASLGMAVLMLLPMLPLFGVLAVSAAQVTTVSGDKVTTIYVSEVYDEAVGQLYNETNQGPDYYFERVRTGDWFTVKVNVEKTGDYHFCFIFGWQGAGGHYTVQVDGGDAVTLQNKVAGQGWRNWMDSSDAPLHLTAGEHTIKVTMNSDGPNIRALKIAPKEMDLTVKTVGGMAPVYDESMGGATIGVTDNIALQFHMTVPFDYINISSASWNNNLGSLRFTLYRWDETYAQTLKGTSVATQDFINPNDNANLRMRFDEMAAGEYLLFVENISDDPQEAIGMWARAGISSHSRTFVSHTVAEVCPGMEIHYTQDTDTPFGTLTPVAEEAVKVEASPSDLYAFGDLTAYSMDANALYGIQFNNDQAFEGVEVYVAAVPMNANQLTLSLYKWNGNYSASVKAEPVATTTMTDVSPGTWAKLSHKAEAGEYLFVISDGAQGMKLYVSETRTENVNHYLHTAASGVSVVARLVGEKKLSAPSVPVAQDFISDDAFTWVATDGLDRTLPTQAEVGGVRENKYVGIFYHTWHADHATYGVPANVTRLVEEYPDALRDYNHPAWNGYNICFWNEPIWGYYNNGVDRYVLRKQAELLADAGVDVVFFDNTNGVENYMAAIFTLCEVWAEARADGVRTPQISCMLNMFVYEDTAKQLIELYDKLYSKGLYRDLWFYWEGKPLMMGYAEELLNMGRQDVYDFFTYRATNPSYTTSQAQILPHEGNPGVFFSGPSGFRKYTKWKWISIYPQETMRNIETRKVEQMCVCVAQNWSAAKGLTAMNAGDMVFGRGYTDKYGVNTSDEAVMAGLNIAEQWEYALEVDPTFIYITGWNEWVAGRYEEMWGDPNAIPDNATDGYSRDIEPSTGMLKDHFYNQMVSYIRKFKGIPAQEVSSGAVSDPEKIDWSAVTPVFRAYEGNTLERDADGYRGYHYENTTGRNDFVESRVTYDAENVYFMVKTAEDITPYTDKAWMRLLIDVVGAEDGKSWETFEYILNRESPTAEKATLERSTGGWNWETVTAVAYTVDGDTMVVTIPRAALGIGDGDFTVNFKWSDNMQVDGDIMDFYTNGDVAPGARYKYSFTTVGAQSSTDTLPPETDPVEPAETVATPTDTVAPTPETPADTTAGTLAGSTDEKNRGCGSVLGATALTATVMAAACVLRRKKKA